MAPWLYRCEVADTIYARDENVLGPEAPLGSEHTVRSVGGQTRGLARWLVSVRALCGWEDASDGIEILVLNVQPSMRPSRTLSRGHTLSWVHLGFCVMASAAENDWPSTTAR